MSSNANSAVYGTLYAAHYPKVLAYCARRVGVDDAADVASEVFLVAWRRIGDLPIGERSLPWLYGVAYRVVSHHWRSNGRRNHLHEAFADAQRPHDPGPETQLVQREEYDLVLKAVQRLRPLDQEVLRLAVWEELSHDQIASVLGVRVPAARQRFHRAKQALAREFSRVGGTVADDSRTSSGDDR